MVYPIEMFASAMWSKSYVVCPCPKSSHCVVVLVKNDAINPNCAFGGQYFIVADILPLVCAIKEAI